MGLWWADEGIRTPARTRFFLLPNAPGARRPRVAGLHAAVAMVVARRVVGKQATEQSVYADAMSGNEGQRFRDTKGIRLTPLDLILTLDVMLLAIPLSVLASHLIFGEVRGWAVSLPATLVVIPFAVWRAGRHRTPPAPPSDDPLRRTGGVLLIALGATLTLFGAVFVFMGLAYVYETVQKGAHTLVLLPVFFIPLLLGHALMYAGARVRSMKPTG